MGALVSTIVFLQRFSFKKMIFFGTVLRKNSSIAGHLIRPRMRGTAKKRVRPIYG
jgi:hypothetical protein